MCIHCFLTFSFYSQLVIILSLRSHVTDRQLRACRRHWQKRFALYYIHRICIKLLEIGCGDTVTVRSAVVGSSWQTKNEIWGSLSDQDLSLMCM